MTLFLPLPWIIMTSVKYYKTLTILKKSFQLDRYTIFHLATYPVHIRKVYERKAASFKNKWRVM